MKDQFARLQTRRGKHSPRSVVARARVYSDRKAVRRANGLARCTPIPSLSARETCERQPILIVVGLNQLFDSLRITARHSPREVDKARHQSLLARSRRAQIGERFVVLTQAQLQISALPKCVSVVRRPTDSLIERCQRCRSVALFVARAAEFDPEKSSRYRRLDAISKLFRASAGCCDRLKTRARARCASASKGASAIA